MIMTTMMIKMNLRDGPVPVVVRSKQWNKEGKRFESSIERMFRKKNYIWNLKI